MPLLVFIIVCFAGLFTTRILLKAGLQQKDYSHQQHAFTLAFGLGLTWLFSFMAPVAVARNFQIEIGLFLFIIFTSVIVWILTYLVDLILLDFINKHRDR